MPINAGHEYFTAEKEYLAAQTVDDKIVKLEALIRAAPKHKGSERLLAGLRLRLKKLKEGAEKARKTGGGKKGLRKEGYQCVLLGMTNSGKSSLLAKLTNAQASVGEFPFTTKSETVGTMDYEGVKCQIVDTASIGSEEFDIGLVNTADCLLIVVDKLDDISKVEEVVGKSSGDRLIVINKVDKYNDVELRKLRERVKSKRLNAILISCVNNYGIDELKSEVFSKMEVVRVYTKEPGKARTDRPMVLPIGSDVGDVAEMILKGFGKKVKEARLTGPSGKFVNQKVGLGHEVKDKDVVEFRT
jgi:uncharacterized protein